VVAAKTDVSIHETMEEPLVGPIVPAGEHGHLAEHPAMDAVFFVAGPDVPAGRDLGRIDLRDVAPTLAERLGLRLPDAEGKPVLSSTQR
jgi:hypothetical protein